MHHIDATPKLLELFWSLVQHACSNETTGKYSCEVSNIYGMDTCHSQVVAVTGLSFVLDSCLPVSQSSIPRDINETVWYCSVGPHFTWNGEIMVFGHVFFFFFGWQQYGVLLWHFARSLKWLKLSLFGFISRMWWELACFLVLIVVGYWSTWVCICKFPEARLEDTAYFNRLVVSKEQSTCFKGWYVACLYSFCHCEENHLNGSDHVLLRACPLCEEVDRHGYPIQSET